MAAQRREAFHHQRRRRRFAGAGPHRRGHDRRPRSVDAGLRQARRRRQGAPYREQDGYQGIADVRAGLHQCSGATGRRPQDGPYQIRDVADERRPSGHRRPVGGSLRGRLPRSPEICPRARAVRQADHPLRRRFGDALQHESQIAGRPRAVVRNHALRRGLQAVRPYRARTFARRRGASGDEVLQPPCRRLHAACQALLVGVRQSAGLRRHPDPRRFGLHEGLPLRASLPRRAHHEYL